MSRAFSIIMAASPTGLFPGWHPIPIVVSSGVESTYPQIAMVLPSLMPLDVGEVIGLHTAERVRSYIPAARAPGLLSVVGPLNLREPFVTVNGKTYLTACVGFVETHWPGVRWYQPAVLVDYQRCAFEAGEILHGWNEGKRIAAVLPAESA